MTSDVAKQLDAASATSESLREEQSFSELRGLIERARAALDYASKFDFCLDNTEVQDLCGRFEAVLKPVGPLLDERDRLIGENERLKAVIAAQDHAEKLDAEWQELVAQTDAEGWDERAAESRINAAWKPVSKAYEDARLARSALSDQGEG